MHGPWAAKKVINLGILQKCPKVVYTFTKKISAASNPRHSRERGNPGKRACETPGKVNGRMDNLWVTMLGGFLGVMAFIGALVFWDRRTFMKRAKEGFEAEKRIASLKGIQMDDVSAKHKS